MKQTHLFIGMICIAALSLMTACKNDVVYSQFFPISSEKWHSDSILRFDYSIPDTTENYTMKIYVRHTELYPYQNMWLFVGDSLQQDTIEFMMADERGRWLGDKNNGVYERPFLFGKNLHYADTGAYYLTVQHGMRDTLLRGIMDIGVEIEKSEM